MKQVRFVFIVGALVFCAHSFAHADVSLFSLDKKNQHPQTPESAVRTGVSKLPKRNKKTVVKLPIGEKKETTMLLFQRGKVINAEGDKGSLSDPAGSGGQKDLSGEALLPANRISLIEKELKAPQDEEKLNTKREELIALYQNANATQRDKAQIRGLLRIVNNKILSEVPDVMKIRQPGKTQKGSGNGTRTSQ